MPRLGLRFLLRIFIVICIVALTFILAGVGRWYAAGGRIFAVQTGSMAPFVKVGDGLLVQKASIEQLQVGDVVSYRSAANPSLIVSHRLVGINRVTGTLTVRGDNLPAPDPPLHSWQIVGKATAVAPHYGAAVQRLRSPLGLVLGVYAPAMFVLGTELWIFATSQRGSSYQLYA